MNDRKNKLLLFLICMIEGGTVMLVETTAPRIIAPFFGTTIYTWAAVLAISMGGLALGYYRGGKLAARKNATSILKLILMISFLLCIALPFCWDAVLNALLGLSLKSATLIASLILIFPILFCFGCVSPLIIGIISPYFSNRTNIAGLVYGLSSLAGVVVAICCGFWLLPYSGLKESYYIFSAILFTGFLVSLFVKPAVAVKKQMA